MKQECRGLNMSGEDGRLRFVDRGGCPMPLVVAGTQRRGVERALGQLEI